MKHRGTTGDDSSQSATEAETTAEDTSASSSARTCAIRDTGVIAGTLGSPALFGAGFAAVDSFGIPSMPSLIGVGAASPLEQARSRNSKRWSLPVTFGHFPRGNPSSPTNRYWR